jgi:hypothetical protein
VDIPPWSGSSESLMIGTNLRSRGLRADRHVDVVFRYEDEGKLRLNLQNTNLMQLSSVQEQSVKVAHRLPVVDRSYELTSQITVHG